MPLEGKDTRVRPGGRGSSGPSWELRRPGQLDHADREQLKPDSDGNPLQPLSQGPIPVQIRGAENFDVTEIDRTTLAFGPNGAPPAPVEGGHLQASKQGFGALLVHFATPETGIAFGDTQACVTGELLDGTPFEGGDSIVTVPTARSAIDLRHRKRSRSDRWEQLRSTWRSRRV